MEKFKTLNISLPVSKLISVTCSAGIPAFVNFIAILLFYRQGKNNFDYILLIAALISVILTLICMIALHNILPRFQKFRPYRKYEGQWLQIIPELKERPYSIIDFMYNKDLRKYELHGINFFDDLSDGVSFDAYRFVERTFKDGFYYITNQTTENKNGLCKIGFVQSNYDELTRAEGYFFDSSSEKCSRKYNTILIKCDKIFYEHLDSKYKYMKVEKIPPMQIMEMSKCLVDKELEKYRRLNKNKMEFCCQNTCEKCSGK